MKPKIKNQDPRFHDLTSRQQRADLNELLCGQLGAPPGTEIVYRTMRIARRGGIFWASMRAEWEGALLDFTVRLSNASGELVFSRDATTYGGDSGGDVGIDKAA